MSSIDKSSVLEADHQLTHSDSSEDTPYIDITVVMDEAERKRRSTWWYKTSLFLWDSVDKHPKERAFLSKLDWFLLSSACAGYFIKNLDQTNIGTAYTNGMKEYYDMKGNDYNMMVTLWTIGYIVGQIPSNLILHRVSARVYLGCLELTWSTLTLLCITCKNMKAFWAIRFLIGLLESGFFPGMEYLFGSWYSKKELSKRSAFFGCSGFAAGLISGPLQQAILNASWAQHHLQPFQWMFVIDAAISFPIAIYTLSFNPNTPTTTKAFYFTEEDKLIALERRRRIGAQLNTREAYTWAKIKSFFNTWHIYVFPILFLCYQNAYQVQTSQVFQLWMKNTLKLDSYYYNTYPSIVIGGGIALSIVSAYVNDYFKGRLNAYFIYFVFIMVTFGASVLAVWDVPIGLHWAAYFIEAIPLVGLAQPMIISWVNSMLVKDDMKRNFVVVVTNLLTYVTAAWVPMFTFNQDDSPEFHIGFIYTACLGGAGIIFTTITMCLANRDLKKYGDENDDNTNPVEYVDKIERTQV